MLARYGRYETLSKIASGGMATVYLGRVSGEGGFERLVALKVMHPHIASDPDFVSMFLDEARLAAQIRHPNVVATIDIQKTDEAMFLVMDYVDGPTLQDIRKHLKGRGERIPVEIAIRVFVDVLSGLQEAHDLQDKNDQPLNLVHRDVSPHNILIGKDGVARLTDFGVARAEARISTTRGGQLKGKIAYMPPEQIMGKDVDRTADIYSAGACLWEALTGRRLWRAANEGALVHAILEGEPTPPSELADVPGPVEAVVLKALSSDAQGRYGEALDMADDLEAAAREAGLKLPRNRDVGRFVRRVAETLKLDPDGKRDNTPAGMAHRPVDSQVGTDRDGSSEPSTPSGTSDAAVATSAPAHLTPTGASPSGPGAPVLSASGSNLPAPHGVPGQAGVSSPSHPIPGRVLHHAAAMPGIDMDHSQPSVVTSPTQSTTTYSLQPKPSRSGAIAVAVAGGLGLIVLVFVAFSGRSDSADDTAFHAYSYAAKTADEKAEALLVARAKAEAKQEPVDLDESAPEKEDPPAPEPQKDPEPQKKRPVRYPVPARPPKPPSEPSTFKPPTL